MGAVPELDTPGILTWTSRDNRNNRIRFLVPVEVYPPGSSAPVPPPEDFVGYIRGLADHGGVYTDQSSLRMDGVEAVIMTATTPAPMDGALGCPAKGVDRTEECFGLQPDLTLRLAAMKVNGKPLLAWARFDNAFPDQAFLSSFDDMLKTVDFGGAPATPAPGYYGYGITSGR
ncbi:hypothetical protein [Arthrobacter cavernae]|uniref:Uncharacterized protein n=1 Tax=Arthrobacter cavernae TaxID=2817681 RepID=A0A939HGK8_9MICC|nr:hypothetical protein [Arthrobacter cavernae]MBO1266948.1 hypothetical protein [Arthrobacter cavernae]